MSIVRNARGFAQQQANVYPRTYTTPLPPVERIRQIAAALTPNHCYVLIEAGAPRWCGLSVPWTPLTELNIQIAQELQLPEWGLLMCVPRSEYGLQLTRLGEHVVAYGLATVLPGLGVPRG